MLGGVEGSLRVTKTLMTTIGNRYGQIFAARKQIHLNQDLTTFPNTIIVVDNFLLQFFKIQNYNISIDFMLSKHKH